MFSAQQAWEHMLDDMIETLRAHGFQDTLAFLVPPGIDEFWPDHKYREYPVFTHRHVPAGQCIGGTYEDIKHKLTELYADD